MITQPSPTLSAYQRSARSLGAKVALPLAAVTAAVLLPASADAQAVAIQLTTGNVLNHLNPNLDIDFDTLTVSPTVNGSTSELRLGISYWDHIWLQSVGPIYGVAVNGSFLEKLADSTPVDSSLSFASSGYFNQSFSATDPQWANASGAYIGMRFISNADHGVHYGWLQVNTNADASEVTLLAFGYNQTPYAAVLTADGLPSTPVPEPATSAALLALGAAGLVAYRRSKNFKRATA